MAAPKTHLEKIEADILDRLKFSLGSKFRIELFPDRPDEFDMPDSGKAVLLQYAGSRYGAAEGTGAGQQSRRAEFAIHLQLRALGKPVRGLKEIEAIRLAVQGFKTQGAELFIVRDGLVEHDAGSSLWKYIIEVGCDLPAVPLPQPAPVPFTTNFASQGG